MEHICILISWLINSICGFASFMYTNDIEKTAAIILKEKLLISLSNLLAVLNVPICCIMAINTTNKGLIEEGKKLLNLFNVFGDTFENLKDLAAIGNKDAEDLLKNFNSEGQAMINNLISIKKYEKNKHLIS